MEGATGVWFDGKDGFAAFGDEVVRFGPDGRLRVTPRKTELALPRAGAHGESDEVLIERSGVRLRLPFVVKAVFRCGAEYVVAHGERESALVRTTAGREQAFELPEVGE
jgi:hypothetical protein